MHFRSCVGSWCLRIRDSGLPREWRDIFAPPSASEGGFGARAGTEPFTRLTAAGRSQGLVRSRRTWRSGRLGVCLF